MASNKKPDDDEGLVELPNSDLPPLPDADDDSYLQNHKSEFDHSGLHSEGSGLNEKEMRRRLMDIESSFLPESSTAPGAAPPTGLDDTYLFGGSAASKYEETSDWPLRKATDTSRELSRNAHSDPDFEEKSPPTPADAYKTPAARLPSSRPFAATVYQTPMSDGEGSTSENVPSSPTAAAAQRNTLRADAATEVAQRTPTDVSANGSLRAISRASTIKATEKVDLKDTPDQDNRSQSPTIQDPPLPSFSRPPSDVGSLRVHKRPTYLRNRQASQRSSQSSVTNKSDISGDALGDMTDFAHHGGEVSTSFQEPGPNRVSMTLSRLPSLGSIASSEISGEDPQTWTQSRQASMASAAAQATGASRMQKDMSDGSSFIPTSNPSNLSSSRNPQQILRAANSLFGQTNPTPANHDKYSNMSFTSRHRPLSQKIGDVENSSPYKNPYHATLTLKEQNAKVDHLTNENHNLKLKIVFLEEAIAARYDENVQRALDENINYQLQISALKDAIKEMNEVHKKVCKEKHELKKQLLARMGGNFNSRPSSRDSDANSDFLEFEHISKNVRTLHTKVHSTEEISEYYKSVLEEKDEIIQNMETENRRMADIITAMNSSQPTNPAKRFNEFYDGERARNEYVEHELEVLRRKNDELESENADLRQNNSFAAQTRSFSTEPFESQADGAPKATAFEQTRQENVELKRALGAQTSMLTSRNKEREVLQQEIEDLKRQARYPDTSKSVSGDSILERSVSRAHNRQSPHDIPYSQTSATLAEEERDEYENRYSSLRNELLQTRMKNQDLERETNRHIDMLEHVEEELVTIRKDRDLVVQDLQDIQVERDEAIRALHEKEQDFEGLRTEALEEIQQFEDALHDSNERNAANNRKILHLQQELDEANRELDMLEQRVQELTSKNERSEIQLESAQSEVQFLRGDQENDKIKIGELEVSLASAEAAREEQIERIRDITIQHEEEARQRDLLESREKTQVEMFIEDLNNQLSKLREESRTLRKNLTSKEAEASSWKERLNDLESSLREILGTLDGTKSSFIMEITAIQQDLETAHQELTDSKNTLAEKEQLLRARDTLLESAGLESRRLSELLEKERQARKQDRNQHEQSQRSQHTLVRSNQQNESRVSELEKLRQQDRRKAASADSHHREQLLERHDLLLAVWNRLSTICGPDWARQNSLVNGELPNLESIARNFPGFKKNLVLALRTVESLIGSFRNSVRNVDRTLTKDYQILQQALDVQIKRIKRLEDGKSGIPELAKTPKAADSTRNSVASTILRPNSAALDAARASPSPPEQEQRWLHRLKELERRLKAEREARLLDRSGARRRLEEEMRQKEELQQKYDREKGRRLISGDDE